MTRLGLLYNNSIEWMSVCVISKSDGCWCHVGKVIVFVIDEFKIPDNLHVRLE